jgi:heme-degrading monooxygenase HmoA
MILEIATIHIKENQNTAFELAFEKAKQVVISSAGCIKATLFHCHENEMKYQVLIEWETLEAHTVNFRESELFIEWRTILSPYFEKAPEVEHFELRSCT